MIRAVQLASSALTTLPVGPIRGEVAERDVAASRRAYPLVEIVLGANLAGLSLGLSRLGIAPGVPAWMLVATRAVLSGGLHLDGLADTFDGLFLAGRSERRLVVMRPAHGEPRGRCPGTGPAREGIGPPGDGDQARAWAIFEAVAITRCLLLFPAGTARYARPADVAVALALVAGSARFAARSRPGWRSCLPSG